METLPSEGCWVITLSMVQSSKMLYLYVVVCLVTISLFYDIQYFSSRQIFRFQFASRYFNFNLDSIILISIVMSHVNIQHFNLKSNSSPLIPLDDSEIMRIWTIWTTCTVEMIQFGRFGYLSSVVSVVY